MSSRVHAGERHLLDSVSRRADLEDVQLGYSLLDTHWIQEQRKIARTRAEPASPSISPV